MAGWGPKAGSSSGGSAGNVIPIGSTQVPGDTQIADSVYSVYNAISAVPANALTTILTFVVPLTPIHHVLLVEFGGTNIARYYLSADNVDFNQYITWFNGSGLSASWDFRNTGGAGYLLTAGSIIRVKCEHGRPFVGDFYARLQYMQVQ